MSQAKSPATSKTQSTVNLAADKGLRLLLTCFLLSVATVAQGQWLRFSTLYGSLSGNAPLVENSRYRVNGVAGSGYLEEITEVNKANYIFTVGLRKLARFDYQVKQGQFYTGQENEISDEATVSNAPGLEYLLEYSAVRNRGDVFTQQEYRVRYISDWFTVRGSYIQNGLVNLKYTQAEARLRKRFGDFDVTFGAAHRAHPVYGYSPIEAWFDDPANKHWWQLANEFGFYSDDNEVWKLNGDVVAQSDVEFYGYHFGRIVNDYNRRELNEFGLQQELSAVLGVDYYKYTDQAWIHSWCSLYSMHRGLSEFSFEYEDMMNMEWDAGLVVGAKLNNHLSIFVEARHLQYWQINSYSGRAGLNYLFF